MDELVHLHLLDLEIVFQPWTLPQQLLVHLDVLLVEDVHSAWACLHRDLFSVNGDLATVLLRLRFPPLLFWRRAFWCGVIGNYPLQFQQLPLLIRSEGELIIHNGALQQPRPLRFLRAGRFGIFRCFTLALLQAYLFSLSWLHWSCSEHLVGRSLNVVIDQNWPLMSGGVKLTYCVLKLGCLELVCVWVVHIVVERGLPSNLVHLVLRGLLDDHLMGIDGSAAMLPFLGVNHSILHVRCCRSVRDAFVTVLSL